MQVDLVVIDARALNLWPAHDPITPLPSPRIKVSCRDEDGVDAINTSAYPQVVSRTFASFHVAKSSVLPAQRDFWDGFDSRQLHRRGP
jgi:hypothetical protein